ncbi:gastrula zinc finger protein xFG20-1-like isoform X2 [Sinocyclocheilus grahami]|uniref:gastrula zinc finger protein xFG20-1-like isoform X2 n=1 Tax=Sinocyclocheilus grahami TaxID=75366 RepID=UPI0007ACA1E1|nr:PREDICTED: gastrula zinc finger protein xFG20-1-like isoform X2 [Sinocyclocheilus grahami]
MIITQMAAVKEEREDARAAEAFRGTHTGLRVLKEESQELNKREIKDQYEEHHSLITGENSLSCSQNEKTLSQKTAQTTSQTSSHFDQHGNLDVDMRIHMGDKPFSCQQCGKSYTSKVFSSCQIGWGLTVESHFQVSPPIRLDFNLGSGSVSQGHSQSHP